MLVIERYDKKPDPHEREIQKDWRDWADKHGYTQVEIIPVKYETMTVDLEIWENLGLEDSHLIFFPGAPHTKGTKLYISDQAHIEFMKDAVKKMVLVALLMIREKVNAKKHMLN